mgnify:CR=1 FL=1
MNLEQEKNELNDEYNQGDFVVYPAHGVGHVLGTEEREIGGSLLELVIVRFDHDKMTLRIPLNKAASSGLRKLSSKKQMDEAISTLKSRAKVRKVMWSRRAQEYESKINSGNLIWILSSFLIFLEESMAVMLFNFTWPSFIKVCSLVLWYWLLVQGC